MSNGVFPFNEDVICVYVDLDRLIEKAGLSKSERKVVGQLMLGYTASDIAAHDHIARQNVNILLNRAVEKICAANNKSWKGIYV